MASRNLQHTCWVEKVFSDPCLVASERLSSDVTEPSCEHNGTLLFFAGVFLIRIILKFKTLSRSHFYREGSGFLRRHSILVRDIILSQLSCYCEGSGTLASEPVTSFFTLIFAGAKREVGRGHTTTCFTYTSSHLQIQSSEVKSDT